MTSVLYDKRGIPFERGDVVKVFHFVGARRKRHYMYKQCLGLEHIGPNGNQYMMFSHLNFISNWRLSDGPYHETPDGRVLPGYEIVQSIRCDHEERPRRALSEKKG